MNPSVQITMTKEYRFLFSNFYYWTWLQPPKMAYFSYFKIRNWKLGEVLIFKDPVMLTVEIKKFSFFLSSIYPAMSYFFLFS